MNKRETKQTIFEFRLDATRDAQKMSRLAFLVSTILALAIILATWNGYFSWYTGFTLEEKLPDNSVTKEVNIQIIKEWVESSSISIPFLGIKVGVSDGSVFGSVGLLIISIWFFLSIRRENHVIGALLRDTKNEEPEMRQLIFHGIISYMVFSSVTQDQGPIKDMQVINYKRKFYSSVRLAFKTLLFLPTFSIAFLILADILTVYILPAFYRFPHVPLFEHLAFGDVVKLILMEGLAFLLLILITIVSWRTLVYTNYTTKVLQAYRKDMNLS